MLAKRSLLLKQVLNALPTPADLQDLFGGIEFVMEGNAFGFIGVDNPVRKVPPSVPPFIYAYRLVAVAITQRVAR